MDLTLLHDVDLGGTGQDLFEFGVGSPADLMKALQANEGVTDIASLTGGSALQKQSLEGQLASITIREELIRLYKRIPKTKAFSTLEEATILQEVGSESGFVGQLENPPQGDAEMVRKYSVVKFLRTHARVGDVLELTSKIVSAINIQNFAAILRILRSTENALFFGDSSIVAEEIDGLYAQIATNAPGNIIDMAGADINAADFKAGAKKIYDNFGRPNIAFLSGGAQSRVDSYLEGTSASVPGAVRLFYPETGKTPKAGEFALGYSVAGIKTSFGYVEFDPDVFLGIDTQTVPKIFSGGSLTEGNTSTQSPAAPTCTYTPNAPVVAGSKWTSAYSGTIHYRISAINQYGKAQATVSQAVTVATNGSVSIAIADGAGANATRGYEIYREVTPGTGVFLFMKRVAKTGPTTTCVDLNADLPGTSKIFMLDMNTLGGTEMRTMFLKQLAPIHKTPLAKIGPFTQWLVNLYITLFVYAPQKQVVFTNVKSS